ncbi:MAG: menD [Acidobacteria bacterium]|nr:menD [Acidobacteriota bacterium]
MTNLERGRQAVTLAAELGARDFAVCAGSRNSPLLAILGVSTGLRLYPFVDERSAAFFALGRAKLSGRPAVVVTTSGTAVAELLPAAIEAYYSGVPLIFITADRPARFRGTGAPQCIEQPALLGCYAATDARSWNGRMALHLNVEFDEPLIDEPLGAGAGVELAPLEGADLIRPPGTFSPREKDRATNGTVNSSLLSPSERVAEGPVRAAHQAITIPTNPIVIVGGLPAGDREAVVDFLLRLGAVVYAEPLSGLRSEERLRDLLIISSERMIGRATFDGVIRIGNVPTLRFWRDLEESRRELPVVHFSDLPFPGLTRGELYPLEALSTIETQSRRRDEWFLAKDRLLAGVLVRLLNEEPRSELALLRSLSRQLPDDTRLYLGNSLPIREWDLAAIRGWEPEIEANRGANGIDGQLSTFFGQCHPKATNVAVVGDLTAIYDLNAPWIVRQLDPAIRFTIVIVNNGGGRIFSRVASLKPLDPAVRRGIIENVHPLHFKQWASMWNLPYRKVTNATADLTFDGRGVLELVPSEASSRRAWEGYDALWGAS